MEPVLVVPLDVDLAGFTQLLWQYRVPHRVVETDDSQQLFVTPGIDPQQIRSLFAYWQQGGDLSRVKIEMNRAKSNRRIPVSQTPFTVAILLLALLVTVLTSFGQARISELLFFTDLASYRDYGPWGALQHMLQEGQLWRIVTPIFLHMSVLHILFNGVWIWTLGQRIEWLQGKAQLLLLLLFSGIVSNFAQYAVSGPLFGGLSGVVFAFLAYCWAWDKYMDADYKFGIPNAFMGFMVVYLAMGFTGVLEDLVMGSIANTAHLAGLVSGLIWLPISKAMQR